MTCLENVSVALQLFGTYSGTLMSDNLEFADQNCQMGVTT